MNAIVSTDNWVSDFVLTLWTPLFIAIFIAIVTYALWPRNKSKFDAAASMPLREE